MDTSSLSTQRALGCSLLCALLWASTGLFIKYIDNLNIGAIMWARFVVACVGGVALYYYRKPRGAAIWQPVTGKEYWLAILMTLYYLSASYAFFIAPVAVVVLTISLSPVFSFILRWLTAHQASRHELIGLILAFTGLLVFIASNHFHSAGYPSWYIVYGALLGALAALCRALFTHWVWTNGQAGISVNITRINVHTLLIGAVLTWPALIFVHHEHAWTLSNISLLLGLGLAATLVPNLLNSLAVLRLSPIIHNTIGLSTPLIASLLAWVLLGEPLTWLGLAGMITLLLGVFWSVYGERTWHRFVRHS